MATTMATSTTNTGGRIPLALQKIFMASNQGQEVHAPPTDHSASRVYRRDRGEHSKPVLTKFTASPAFQRTLCSVPPQAKFHLKLKERGYSPRNFSSKRSAYYNAPTEHQLASYGSAMLQVVKQNRVDDLRLMLEAGLSPNACNAHGESLLHMVCRHGKVDLFHILVAFDVDIQQTDDYGRTPLHDACWAAHPSFDIAAWLIRRDPALLFLYDARGSLPLSYVTKSLWQDWNEFLDDNMDHFFPANHPLKHETPLLCTLKPNTRPVPNPKDKIPTDLARQVAMGTMSPYHAILAMHDDNDDDEETVQCSEFDDETSLYDDSSSEEEDDETESDYDSDEEEELYQIVGQLRRADLGTIQED